MSLPQKFGKLLFIRNCTCFVSKSALQTKEQNWKNAFQCLYCWVWVNIYFWKLLCLWRNNWCFIILCLWNLWSNSSSDSHSIIQLSLNQLICFIVTQLKLSLPYTQRVTARGSKRQKNCCAYRILKTMHSCHACRQSAFYNFNETSRALWAN